MQIYQVFDKKDKLRLEVQAYDIVVLDFVKQVARGLDGGRAYVSDRGCEAWKKIPLD